MNIWYFFHITYIFVWRCGVIGRKHKSLSAFVSTNLPKASSTSSPSRTKTAPLLQRLNVANILSQSRFSEHQRGKSILADCSEQKIGIFNKSSKTIASFAVNPLRQRCSLLSVRCGMGLRMPFQESTTPSIMVLLMQ